MNNSLNDGFGFFFFEEQFDFSVFIEVDRNTSAARQFSEQQFVGQR
jgi:hypothetical protein